MLAVLARVAAMSGQLERATSALAELASEPQLSESHQSAAELARAQGELSWARGDLTAAEPALRASITHWLELRAPLHAAQVRVRLFDLLILAGDATAAELELSSAEAALKQASAAPLVAQCQRLRAGLRK